MRLEIKYSLPTDFNPATTFPFPKRNFHFSTIIMRVIAVLCLCVVACLAAPQAERVAPAKPFIPIVRMIHNSDNLGRYDLDVLGGDQTVMKEEGVLKDLGDKEGPVSVKTGSYAFTAPDGKVYSVRWTSDENGFLAQGEHFPTPPPIPAEIVKSLEFNRQEELQHASRPMA